jgi:ABC-2 type transport system ATP-binding protein
MIEAETLCDRVAIIDQGLLLALGTVAELKESLPRDQVTHIEGVISARAAEAVRQLPAVKTATRASSDGSALLTVVAERGKGNLSELIETLTRHGALLQKIAPEDTTLEDVFIAKTGRSLAEDTRK